MARKASQWYAIVDADGELVSSGTVVAKALPAGLEAIAVDAPEPRQVWDPKVLAWVTPEMPPTPPNPVAVLVDLSVVAADGTKTLTQKLEQIIEILAAAGQ